MIPFESKSQTIRRPFCLKFYSKVFATVFRFDMSYTLARMPPTTRTASSDTSLRRSRTRSVSNTRSFSRNANNSQSRSGTRSESKSRAKAKTKTKNQGKIKRVNHEIVNKKIQEKLRRKSHVGSTSKYEDCVMDVKAKESSWCSRHNFPAGQVDPSGHRCYNPWAVCHASTNE